MCKLETIDTITALRGMVFFADLGNDSENKKGTIMKKCRPCVIYSVDKGYNDTNPRRYTIIPISNRENDPVIFSITEVLFSYKNNYQVAVVDSMCAISSYDLKNYIYTLSPSMMDKIDKAVKVHLGYESQDILEVTEDDVTDYRMFKSAKNQNNYIGIQSTPNKIIDMHTRPNHVTYLECKELTQKDFTELRKKGNSKWNLEECLSFMESFNTYDNMEVARMMSVTLKHLYQIKYLVNKKLIENNIKKAPSGISDDVINDTNKEGVK